MTATESELLYRKSVEHIACNDDPGEMSAREVERQISVQLVADVFGKSARQVARAVVRLRTERRAAGAL